MLTGLKITMGVLGAVACLIPYLALTESYERDRRAEPTPGRVVSVDADAVRYERHSPGSTWDEDGDGWIGPYTDDGVPDEVRAVLQPGDQVTVRAGVLEQSLAPPSPLLLVGVVLCLLFAVWSFVGPRLERRAIDAARQDPERLLTLMIRKSRATKTVAALLLLAMGGGIAAVALIAERTGEQIFLLCLGGAGLLMGLVTAAGAWALRRPDRAPVLRRLREEPERFVWMYVEEVEGDAGMVVRTVHLCADDGERYDFHLLDLDPSPLLDVLRARLPGVLEGFDGERAKQWKQDPASLRRG